jgi:putative membrane protein
MTTWQLLTSTWHWHPSVLLGCEVLLIGYAVAVRFRWSPAALWYVAGVVVLLLALLSPLHMLGDDYLFSAHMLQHLLLMQCVPPLLLVGLPPAVVRQALQYPLVRKVERVLGHPWVAWSLGTGAMWLWHLPVLYNAALRHETLHIVEHLCFLATAVIFWWPILAPAQEVRLLPPAAMFYLFTAMIASSVLGIILTFVPPGLYPTYLHPIDIHNILPLLRDNWGLTPAVDQQLGGLLMWMPGSLIYLCAIIATLARWYGTPEEDLQPAVRDPRPLPIAAMSSAREEQR